MANLHERMQRDERMKREWALLRNQREMLGALDQAMRTPTLHTTWGDEASTLSARVAYELYLTCQRIWDLSAKQGEVEAGV